MRNHLTYKPVEGTTTVLVVTTCPLCGDEKELAVTKDQLRRWEAGGHAQVVFTGLDATEREALITGTCARCWELMFAEPDWDEKAEEKADRMAEPGEQP